MTEEGREDPHAGENLPVAIGEIVGGKYRVDSILGMGGMGVVVAATHVQLLERVALKFLLGRDKTQWTERFMREARAVVRLKSEHVAKVLDVGTLESGAPFIVMEFLEGETLGSLLRRQGVFEVSEAVGYVLQACEGIAEAHAKGIIHRDLKPENLFMATRVDGRPLVKVLDFGVAKSTEVTSGAELTTTRDVVGSPAYMSPEQLRSAKAIDARSDLWALGVILYELLTNRIPFDSSAYSDLVIRIVNEPPTPLSKVRSDLPPGIEAIVLRCLEKDAARRYANVAEFAAALLPFAPADGRDMPERVRAVLERQPIASLPPTASGPGLAATVPASTTVRPSTLSRASKARSSTRLVFIGAVLLLGATKAWMMLRSKHQASMPRQEVVAAAKAPLQADVPLPLASNLAPTPSSSPVSSSVVGTPGASNASSNGSRPPLHVAPARHPLSAPPIPSATAPLPSETTTPDAGEFVHERK